MGFTHITYVAYGVQVPVAEHGLADEVERVAGYLDGPGQVPGMESVRYLTAGGWGEDMLFLVTSTRSVALGRVLDLGMDAMTATAGWDRQLDAAVEGLGLWQRPGLKRPGWMVIPDVS